MGILSDIMREHEKIINSQIITDYEEDINDSPIEVIIKEGQFDVSRIKEYKGIALKKLEFRPTSFSQFIGQTEAKERGKTIIKRAKKGLKAHFLVDGIKGHGKCHAIGTKILMYDGSLKNVENIKVGDTVMGIDSKPRTVQKTGTGFNTLYNIQPSKGDSFIVNGEHILSLKKTGTEKILNISVNDYLKSSTTITSMYELYRVPVKFNQKELPLEPYFLGLWLGDGTSANSSITNIDNKIWNYLRSCAKRLKMNYKNMKHREKANRITISEGRGREYNRSIISKLRQLNLLNNKHIPDIYKINSRKNRLKLLAGLMDSDGWLNDGCCYEIVTKFDALADDIQYLAGSLGFMVTKKIKKVRYKEEIREYWRLSIMGDCTVIPVKLNRKKAKKRRINKDPLKTGFTVTKLTKGKFYGFELDGDHLYMIENFIVNHNTTFVELIAKELDAHIIKRIGKQVNIDNLVDIINEIHDSDKQFNILFIDEIDTMDKNVIKCLNPIIESFEVAGKRIKPFIFSSATINKHVLIKNNPDTLDRISPSSHIKFERYNNTEMCQIISQYTNELYNDENVDEDIINIISQNCKYNPRSAIALLEDYIVEENINKVLKNCHIKINGLTTKDLQILNVLSNSSRPMGAKCLALKCGMSEAEYLMEFEPFLVEYDYINRVPSRIITDKGKEVLNESNLTNR